MLQLSPFDYLSYIQFVFTYCVPLLSPRLYCTVYLFFRQLQLTDELKFERKKKEKGGGSKAQWLAYLLPDPAAPGLIPNFYVS